MSKLALEKLSKNYGKENVVDNVSLRLEPGEFVSLLGPSGCGKTTTLRMIAGFVKPSAGTIEIDGRVVSSADTVVPPEHRRMSMIFQSYAIWPNMTVGENVAFGLKIRKLDADTIRRKLDEILTIVQLNHLKDRYPSELSGGQQQRVALARAIVIEPEVLLLDEPLSNLDANLREEMRTEIRRLHNAFRITTVYVTHDQSEAMTTSDRIVVMNKGRVEQVDPPFQLYNHPRTAFVAGFIGRTNLLSGKLANDTIVFPGFGVPVGPFDELRERPGGEGLFSIRPQHIQPHRAAPATRDGRWWLEGSVAERAYLGDYWDYSIRVGEGETRLRVAASPHDIYEQDDRVWLEIDPQHVTCLEPEADSGNP